MWFGSKHPRHKRFCLQCAWVECSGDWQTLHDLKLGLVGDIELAATWWLFDSALSKRLMSVVIQLSLQRGLVVTLVSVGAGGSTMWCVVTSSLGAGV